MDYILNYLIAAKNNFFARSDLVGTAKDMWEYQPALAVISATAILATIIYIIISLITGLPRRICAPVMMIPMIIFEIMAFGNMMYALFTCLTCLVAITPFFIWLGVRIKR